MSIITRRTPLLVAAVALSAALAGCQTAPYNNGGYARPAPSYDSRPARCANCGVVKEVQQVYVERKSNGTLGAVIGAVAGGLLGNTVGKGDGRKAATVAGAVAGGVVGNKVATAHSGTDVAWRVTVRLDGGRYVTVTQPDDPRVREGDYVQVQDGRVYPR
ncbi:MAG: glycine zipper 2TM domain-containing protein [Xanthomonadaceae bacterium]|nr:glycine zipper 2TM domain-containing protein [Xanthomonadaceae bacterium]MDE1963504.1 glycine zipper 2TM domain-containing protein [Xanthomonadaceae bacterium]